MAPLPHRGEIWLADLHPTWGHEQAGARPVLVISTNTFNYGPADLVFVLPVTRTDRRIPLHVPIDPPEGGVTTRSYIVCDALCSMATERLGPPGLGPRLRRDVTQSGGPSGPLASTQWLSAPSARPPPGSGMAESQGRVGGAGV
jgi:mRNA interferase MazF